MNRGITKSKVVQRHEENKIQYSVLTLQNDISIVVSQLGGRILGPFPNGEGESILWMPEAWREADTFRELLRSDWNIGGDRLWVGPEIQYFCRNRNDYWGTGFIPPEIDPGSWKMEKSGPNRCRLYQDMTIEAYNLSSGTKSLFMEATTYPTEDPLRSLSNHKELIENVTYAGYEEVITLSEKSSDDILSTTWNILQLYPGGTIIIPTTTCVRITGKQQYKIGYKSTHVTGRMAYYNEYREGSAYLIIRSFYNNPSSIYPEEPPKKPGLRGDSVFVYNDDGDLGGFGEMECMGQAIGGPAERSSSTDPMALWFYLGPIEKIKVIVLQLLGRFYPEE